MSSDRNQSPAALAYRAFKKSRPAVVGAVILAVFYLMAGLGGFIAPYSYSNQDLTRNYSPPTHMRFVLPGGAFTLRPYVCDVVPPSPEIIAAGDLAYREDATRRFFLRFFVRGDEYQLLGFIPATIHLFGIDPAPEPERKSRIYLLGADQYGRDVFSRLLYGAQVSLTIGPIGILISFSIGIVVGGVSGFYSGVRLGSFLRQTALGFVAVVLPLFLALTAVLGYYRPDTLKYVAIAGLVLFAAVGIGAMFPRHVDKLPVSVDDAIQRFIEIIMSLPGLYLILALRAMLPTRLSSVETYFGIVVILAFIYWASLARVVRGMVLSIRQLDFIQAAQALGASDGRVILRHVLPGTVSFLIVQATLTIPYYILSEVALSFLGVGIQEPQASWGNMLNESQNVRVLSQYPWIMFSAGGAIFFTVLAYNFLGDGLRDALDPKAKPR
ncbi:MAG: ABC transporter permease [Acidobacteriota bacterium]